MLAACKAAFSGRVQAGSTSRLGGPPSPSEKQVEAFVRALSERQLDQVAAYVAESRVLLVSPLKCHPARSSAWHLAAEARGGPGEGSGGDSALLELLLQLHGEHDFPPEGLQELVNTPNRRGQTCLHVAAARGNTAAVRLLLQHGGDLQRPDKSGRTALHLAAAAGSEECARVLLAEAEAEEVRAAGAGAATESDGDSGSGGAISSSSSSGVSPTASSAAVAAAAGAIVAGGSAAAQGQGQQQQQLPPVGPGSVVWRFVNAVDSAGLTALHFAAAANSLPLTRLLLAAGASYMTQAVTDNFEASMPCNAGWTCLHVAAMRGHYDVAMLILRHHSSRSAEEQVADWRPCRSNRTSDPRAITDRRGSTAASVASARSFPDLAALLNPDTPMAHIVQGAPQLGPDGRELLPPAMFVCPITQEVMRDPVVASDGFTYERAAISKWLSAGKLTSPMTNLPFTSRALYPNNVIKSGIKEWRQQNGLPDPDAPASRRSARRQGAGGGRGVDVNNVVGAGTADPFLSQLRAHGM